MSQFPYAFPYESASMLSKFSVLPAGLYFMGKLYGANVEAMPGIVALFATFQAISGLYSFRYRANNIEKLNTIIKYLEQKKIELTE